MDWSGYFEAQSGRDTRPLLLDALDIHEGDPGVALDLGCGEGTETRHLLRNGWTVHAYDGDPGSEARVQAGLTPEQRDRLRFRRVRFERLWALPRADLVHSSFALPFCRPDEFPRLWARIRSGLRPGAVLAVTLFGPHDDWAGRTDMNFHDRAEVLRLLDGLSVHSLVEDDRPGQSAFGPRHWHVHYVIARATAVDP